MNVITRRKQMSIKSEFEMESLTWLLEPNNPGARYLALRDLCDLTDDDPELQSARKTAHAKGDIATILAAMNPEGFWEVPGPGYRPKYRSTVWSIIMLAQLGASIQGDERISKGCTHILDHALAKGGRFSVTGTPSSTADCLQGNLCWALVELGVEDDRLESAFEWMARSVTGEGVSPKEDKKAELRYYASKCGPNFACGSNNKLPCAWGAAKVMLAFSHLPAERRPPLIENAIQQGVDFFFSTDPAKSDYPSGFSKNPSRNWWKFGFPVFYVTDMLQIVEALIRLGYGSDPRLKNALALIKDKADRGGRWNLEYDYTGKTWVDFGVKKQPNKWVTIRALRALKAVAE
jgi:hypothetical protein